MMIDWATEWPLIRERAIRFGVDPYFIAAIRCAENGGPGKEFGVLSVPAPAYEDQLGVACESVRNRMTAAPILMYERRCYSAEMISEFSKRWAPPAATNDPSGLNANWFRDAWSAYTKFCREKEVT